MKKVLLLVSLFTVGASFAQNCSEIFISEYVEGSGNDKAIELYNPTAVAVNLSTYTIERHSNGDANAVNGGTLVLSGTIQPFSTFVVVNGQTTGTGSSPACSPALQLMADQLDGVYPAPTYMNGNDAILLLKNGVMIDIMGKSGDASIASSQSWSDEFPYDGSVGAWWTKDHTLIRKATVLTGVAVNPDPFIVTTEWDSLPKDTWTSLGTHTCNCLVGLDENVENVAFSIYPNPAKNSVFVSADFKFKTIVIVDVLGKEVLTKAADNVSKAELNVSSLGKGIYFVKIESSNSQIATKQLIVE